MKKYKYTGIQPFYATFGDIEVAAGSGDTVLLDPANPYCANLIATGAFVEETEIKNKSQKPS